MRPGALLAATVVLIGVGAVAGQTYVSTCPVQTCAVTTDCTYSGCISGRECTAAACSYQAKPEQGCTCVPGQCGADGGSICTCIANGTVIQASAMLPCPADFPACSGGRCRCQAGAKQCTDGGTVRTCNPQGDWDVTACSAGARCVDGECRCNPNAGKPCGHCGGFTLCDGKCSKPDPVNYGVVCMFNLGPVHLPGHVQCDGKCYPDQFHP
ncbi:MAG TPA: hypothetical protein VND93_23310 [Myxococcales bacterium]|nr:hypothetical protein [Myxococcales bacterium]